MAERGMHQYGQDLVAQRHVEGRKPIVPSFDPARPAVLVGMDFGREESESVILVVEGGKVVRSYEPDTYFRMEKLRQDRLIARMDRGGAWRAMKSWLLGGLRHGR